MSNWKDRICITEMESLWRGAGLEIRGTSGGQFLTYEV